MKEKIEVHLLDRFKGKLQHDYCRNSVPVVVIILPYPSFQHSLIYISRHPVFGLKLLFVSLKFIFYDLAEFVTASQWGKARHVAEKFILKSCLREMCSEREPFLFGSVNREPSMQSSRSLETFLHRKLDPNHWLLVCQYVSLKNVTTRTLQPKQRVSHLTIIKS